MPKIYRGTSAEWVDAYCKTPNPKSFDPTGGGEFGQGCYFWLDDLPAAIMSAVQYNANERDWGVIELEFESASIEPLAARTGGYGSRVIEFEHSRTSLFGSSPGHFVVPKDYSHIPVDKALQASGTYTPLKPGNAPKGTARLMQSEDFRKINAAPDKYGLDGEKNTLVWQYDLVIGKCAADYSDPTLVQMKFANHGMTFLNNPQLCTRLKVITGKKVTKHWKTISAWKMSARKDLFATYFEGKTTVDLDKALG